MEKRTTGAQANSLRNFTINDKDEILKAIKAFLGIREGDDVTRGGSPPAPKEAG